MNDRSEFEILRGSPLAAELDDDECRVLAGAISRLCLKDHEMLLEENATDQSLYVLVTGRLAVVKETGGGDCVVLHVYREGDMVGELGFIDGTPHSAGLRAEGYAELIALEREAFEGLVGGHPTLVYKVMKAIVRTVHTIMRRMNVQYVELTNYITKQHGKY